ncbi:MAG: hypothetical protein ABEH38_07405 [Flavobacteriales bacterium]
MRFSVLLLFFLISTFSLSFAQTSTRITDSGWRIGANIGGAYQGKPLGEKELDPSFGMGWGFTLGKMLYQRPGKFFNVGLRGRFLWEMTKGISTEKSYAIGLHPRPNNDKRFDLDIVGQHYQDSLGYVYPNYRQEGRQYDLEVTLGFNKWAEKTNFLFYLFGGVGVTNFQVRTDQLNGNGEPYDYGSFNGNPSKDELRKKWDGKYETEIYEGGKIHRFIPSGGFGVIYQINRSLGLGFEHKISFPENEDLFDAKEFGNGFDPAAHSGGPGEAYDAFTKTPRQDLYHYTSLTFRWRIISRTEKEEEEDEEEPSTAQPEPRPDQYTDQSDKGNEVHARPPKVDIVHPPQSPHTTTQDSFELRARIDRVNGVENVTLRVDGQEIGQPNFDPSTGLLEQKIALSMGDNQVKVRGVNEQGSDVDQARIVRKGEEGAPPKVRITEPASDPFTSYDPVQGLKANVLNVPEKDSISFRLNGTAHSFEFLSDSNRLKAELDLIQGANRVKVAAWNKEGRASDTRTIIYKKENTLDPPKVWITYPSSDPFVVVNPNVTVKAGVEGIASRHDITVVHNGNEVNDFNYYPNNGALTMNRSLDPGANTFRIKVQDQGGSDRAQQRFILRDQQEAPPDVNFKRPASSGNTVSSAGYRVRAVIDHVSSPSQIAFKMNGTERSGFAFNPSTGELIYDAHLRKGKNRFRIRAVNSAGADVGMKNIHYKDQASGHPPSVRVIDPAKEPYETTHEKPRIKVKFEHVGDKSGVHVRMNGGVVSDFQYDEKSGELLLQKSLVEGRNYFTFKGVNQYGVDQAERSIIYTPKSPPSVNIVDPASGQKVVHSPDQTVKAKLLRVPDASRISFKLNGSSHSQFKYDPKSGNFEAPVQLNQGVNEISLKGSNPDGTDFAKAQIRYQKAAPPEIKIIKPDSNPHQTSQSKIAIKGKVSGVNDKQNLKLVSNGQSVQNFQFLQNGLFKYNMSLQAGENEFVAKAQNPAGKASDTRVIHRMSTNYMKDAGGENKSGEGAVDKKGAAPEVTIESPSSSETSVNGVQVIARVENADKVQLFVNGVSHSFSRSGERLEADVALEEGTNNIEVYAENDNGSDREDTNIDFQPVREATGDTNEGSDSGNEGDSEEEEEADTEESESDNGDDGDGGGGHQVEDEGKKEKKDEDKKEKK